MNREQITKRRGIMIILDVKLDNIYAFKKFHLNLTYPKKIIGSNIENEHLINHPNFRYKKVNVIMGANASGKTTLGKALMKIFNFIHRKNYETITSIISDNGKEASFSLDMVFDEVNLYRIVCVVTPAEDGVYSSDNIKVTVQKEPIKAKDNYEMCTARMTSSEIKSDENYINELEKLPHLDWMFRYPEYSDYTLNFDEDDEMFPVILEKVLKALDISIHRVTKSQDVNNAYIIRLENKSIILQSGERLKTELLSSGTIAGIQISEIVSSIIQGKNTFYYCDEKFTHIQSDMEKAIFSLMVSSLKDNSQLFFTTHNTNILDMNLPKHSFTFLRKNPNVNDCVIESVNASSFLKRNTDSLKNAVENDLFCIAPSVDEILNISDLI